MPAKWFIRKLAERLTNSQIPDLNSGLRAFRREVALPYLRLLPPGFSCVTTITLAFLSNQHDVRYVPIEYAKRAGTSKFKFVKDAYRYILQVLRMVMYFNPLKVLMPVALFLLGLGIAKGIYDMVVHPLHVRGQHRPDLRDRADHRLAGAARRPDRPVPREIRDEQCPQHRADRRSRAHPLFLNAGVIDVCLAVAVGLSVLLVHDVPYLLTTRSGSTRRGWRTPSGRRIGLTPLADLQHAPRVGGPAAAGARSAARSGLGWCRSCSRCWRRPRATCSGASSG